MLQYAMNLSDRQAAEAVRCRIDFTYALGLDLDDPGFHQSVLYAFRDRLAEGDRADRLPSLALTRIRRAGLLKGRVTQRTDSTHVLSAARELTRLELVTEAVRAVLEEVARDAPEVLDELATAEWAQATAGRFACAPSPATPSPAWSRWATTPANCCNALTTGFLGWHGADSPCRSPTGACTASPSAWGDHSALSFGVFGNRRTWRPYRAW
ncbi:transposase [Streptomyces sp. NPDC002491]